MRQASEHGALDLGILPLDDRIQIAQANAHLARRIGSGFVNMTRIGSIFQFSYETEADSFLAFSLD